MNFFWQKHDQEYMISLSIYSRNDEDDLKEQLCVILTGLKSLQYTSALRKVRRSEMLLSVALIPITWVSAAMIAPLCSETFLSFVNI